MRRDSDASLDTTIQLEASFDGIAARRVEALLTHAAAGARFVVDLSQVREIHDFALAVLANALTHTAADVTVRGLRQHQIRMLRYFGVETERLDAASVATAA